MADFKRREFLKTSAAFAAASAAGGFGCVEIASAAPIEAPVVDRLSVRVLVDGAYNLFLRPGEVKGVKIERPPRESDYRRAIHNEWGFRCSSNRSAPRTTHRHARLRLHADRAAQQHGTARRRPQEDRSTDRQPWTLRPFRRPASAFSTSTAACLPADLTLYAGGEDNFCTRHQVLAVQGWRCRASPVSANGERSTVASLRRGRSRPCWPKPRR